MQAREIEQARQQLASVEDPLGLMLGLFVHAPSAFAINDARGHCVMVNRAFLELFGSAPPAEYSVLQDELAAARGITPLIYRALGGETVKTPTFWYDPAQNGRVQVAQACRVAISITCFPIRDATGAVSHFGMAYEDRTAESEARDRLRQIIDLVPMYVYARDRAGRYLLVNQMTADGFKRTPEQVEGRTYTELMGASYPQLEARLQEERNVMDSGQMQTVAEDVVTRDGHSPRTFFTMRVPYTTPGTGGQAVLGVSLDITDRLNLEAQLRQSQKMDGIGRLAGGVAHDFNNLMTVILGFARLVLAGLSDTSSLRDDVDEIQRAAERAADLTRQLLAFSRQQVLAPRVVTLNEIIVGMDRMFRRLIGEDIEFFTLASPDLPPILVDTGQIEQVLMNLVLNARDAMPEGGKLTIETCAIELDEAYASSHSEVVPGTHVMLAVTDTGSGIDKATQARIFEPFFTTKPKGKGTGLGLSTVFGIVKQSGGHIWVYSEEGKGTTFKLYFPVTRAQPTPASPSAPVATQRVSETILVVEDEPQLAKLMVRILTGAGYQVLAARSGREAIELSANHTLPIQLLLTDVIMPQMSGKQLAAELALRRPTMKVLYVSGYTDNSIVHHGILDPGVAFLQKPFSFDTLTKKVREVLES
jgi:two-component system, cell cycle sensor histidine kinase and response regulator CckA